MSASATVGAIAHRPSAAVVEPGARTDRPLLGIALILGSGVVFSVADAISKLLATDLPVIEVTWLRWLGLLGASIPAVLTSRGTIFRSAAPRLQVMRAVCLLGSSVLFTAGLPLLPLASATTINFVSPMMVTALSILMLGEVVGARRWAAVLVGLFGVVIVVRPGSGTFGAAAALPILSAACWALGTVTTRKIGGQDRPWTSMAYTAFIGVSALSLAVAPVFVVPDWRQIGLAVLLAIFATAGQFLSLLGYRTGQASLLAPFTYLMLIWSTGLGYGLFGNVPDLWTGIGAAIIVASGLYTAHRERVRAREAAVARRG